jgi:hypothetical protein
MSYEISAENFEKTAVIIVTDKFVPCNLVVICWFQNTMHAPRQQTDYVNQTHIFDATLKDTFSSYFSSS